MKKERMRIQAVPSTIMDSWAQKNNAEHDKIRLSRKARNHYKPHEWDKVYLTIHGTEHNKKLRIGQAPLDDIKENTGFDIGFVTTATYKYLMGPKKQRTIWVSEAADKLTIGCDPEFVLVDKEGHWCRAANVIVDPNKNKVFGHDGPCAEIRPKPSESVDGLIANIKSALENPEEKIINYSWIGGATYKDGTMTKREPIGGHIHIGLPNIPGGALNTDMNLQMRIGRILDELVVIPLIRIDTPMPENRRSNNYGYFGDLRTYTFKMEWRTPSGIWLIHPHLALAIIGTTKAVTEEAWKRYADRDFNKSFMLETTAKDNLLKSFNCLDTEKARKLVNEAIKNRVNNDLINNIYSRLKQMTTYDRYKEHIDYFCSICKSSNMPPTSKKLDIREGWFGNTSLL